MNISYNWLKEYVDFDLTAQQVADALTSIGLEVDAVSEVETIRGGLKGLVVGQVMDCQPHPNSDHMHICQVDEGTGELVQIVCGAPNVSQGQKVIVATLGCKLYDGDKEFVIKRSKLRGVESLGMICAEDEIGVGTDHQGIIVLPEDTPVGMPAAEYYKVESDWLIEIDITPNRADACSHYGVARDLYAWLVENGYKTSLHRQSVDAFKVDNHDYEIKVNIVAPERCRRYTAVCIKDCEVKESPKWMQDKLRIIGLRPINNIVDITNYIMMAYGQPLHCFDADMIEGKVVNVQTLEEGTPFVTLDGVEHKLSSEDLAICNAKEPMCIAGVLGGKGSGTYESTKNILLESACFDPTSIRKSVRRHGLSTDASFRFERGVDPNGCIYALKQAALLVQELAGGKVAMDIVDVYSRPQEPFAVSLLYDYVHSLIGKVIPVDTIKSICKSLEMEIVSETPEGLNLRVPTYRVDVQRPCDVVEDILRIYGYNNVEIPEMVLSSLTVKGDIDRANKWQNLISEQLTGAGFREIMNNSLTRSAYYQDGETYPESRCVRILNALSEDLSVMRQTMLYGGLESIRRNINHQMPNLKFYEFGNCYQHYAEKADAESPLKAYAEEPRLALWVTGKAVESSWAHADLDYNFYMLKAHVMHVLERLGISYQAFKETSLSNDIFSQALQLSAGEQWMVRYGIVNTKQADKVDLHVTVYYAEFNWHMLLHLAARGGVNYADLCKYPAVRRDLALLLNEDTTFAQIEAISRQAERKLLKHVELFDVYEGKGLPAGKKSYAVAFTLQDEVKTMSDKQIEKSMTRIVEALKQQLGAQLR